MISEWGHWPYPVPFFELPAEKGMRILQLASRSVPYRISLLAEVRDAVQALAPAQE